MFSEGREPPFQAQDTLRAWQEKVDETIHSMNTAIGSGVPLRIWLKQGKENG